MHPKERYEQIITSKLEALPLPDMADAIWARIEQQLDMDMPTDNGGDVPEPPAPSGGGILKGAGLLTVVGALLAFLYFQKPKPNNPLPIAQPQTILSQPDTSATSSNPDDAKPESPPGVLPARPDNTALFAPPLDSGQTGIVASAPSPTSDSVTAVPEAIVQAQVPDPAKPKKDSIPKKRRGVQNISDNDYRIVPKKDSVP